MILGVAKTFFNFPHQNKNTERRIKESEETRRKTKKRK
jgi:hypothetical protein